MTSILYFMYLRGKGSVKAGEYEFRKNATMRQVLDTLVEGKSIEHKVTLARRADQPADGREASRPIPI